MKHARRARVFLADFLESLELPRELAAKAQGHGIPLFSPLTRRPFCRRNILLAGDAASFVDPVTAEGIYYALKSGEEAARAIIKTLPSGGKAASIYTNLLERGILTELKAAWKLSLAFYAFPLISFNAIMTNARIREMQFDVMVGRRSYVELMKEFPRMTSLMKKLLFTRFVSWKKHL